jgi:2-keto-4-pentenoate hydratase/2-oxohepta-3-ene-1,7-dioic acid hydratase in catechol pathway
MPGSAGERIGAPIAQPHQIIVLEPGDLINTGTPPGTGMAFSPGEGWT